MLGLIILLAAAILAVVALVQSAGRSLTAWSCLALAAFLLLGRL